MSKENNEFKESQSSRAQSMVLQRRMPVISWFRFSLWNLGLMFLACAALTYFSLRLSYGNLNPQLWLGYWKNPVIPAVNLLLLFTLAFFLFVLTGRTWLAFLLTAILCLAVTFSNYFLIVIRTDPLYFQDLSCLREALAITETQGYELELTNSMYDSIAISVIATILLALLSRWRPHWTKYRVVALLFSAGLMAGALFGTGASALSDLMKNTYADTWSVAEIYTSRGIVYSFARSILYGSRKPADYSEPETEELLKPYTEENIPADRKADVFVIMRESYADLSALSSKDGALDFSAYDWYHDLIQDSVLKGTLVTNGFGGNTKNAERCFLTGCYTPSDWRQPTNSYVWYLKEQGYRTEGAHPFNGWFYNRLNVNRYLGFDRYLFREDSFQSLEEKNKIVDDNVLYDAIWQMYEARDSSKPYFNFSVTYEGHGPYNYSKNLYPKQYVLEDAATSDGYAMNNYLGCIAHRDEALKILISRFRSSNCPIVLLLYGDHKATLGKEINNYTTAAYEHFGMNLNLRTAEGFQNYYSTDYVIWMNAAAKAKLGVSGALKIGPTISPCYLMNVLFDTLDWGKGPDYLQAMQAMMEVFPVYSTKGLVSLNGQLTNKIPADYLTQYQQIPNLSYYWQTNFRYTALTETLQTN